LPQGAEIFNTDKRETQILAAAEHVKLARVQRQLFNSYIATAREDATNKVPHSERTYMQIGNYCQKMEMPYFGAKQPGDTYYMSPLTINCFGLVDPTGMSSTTVDNDANSIEWRHTLHAYVYAEGVAGCGGNNVASLLIRNLHDAGLLDLTKGPGGHPVATFDNCPELARTKTIMFSRFSVLGSLRKVYFQRSLLSSLSRVTPRTLVITSSMLSRGSTGRKTLKPSRI
jgi:hypothetical protein